MVVIILVSVIGDVLVSIVENIMDGVTKIRNI